MKKGQLLKSNILWTSVVAVMLIPFSCLKLQQSKGENSHDVTQKPTYVIVDPGTHPSLLFSTKEIKSLRKKIDGNPFTKNMWNKIMAYSEDWTLDGEWINQGMEMDAKALIYQIDGDEEKGREALDMLKSILTEIDPHDYYFDPKKSNIFWTDDWPKAFAFAYDWLNPLMTNEERIEISDQLALWCKALYEHTEPRWWREASYNVGAIPVGALGILCVAIQNEKKGDPEFEKWLNSAIHRIRDNYFPTTWRQNGICYEGPDYAQYLRNPVLFGEALRRTGGPDILTTSGAINGMNYQRHQWMPGGEESPIGDNTTYGRRVFQSIYLLGIGEMKDKAGLHTFLKWTEPDKIDPIFAFLFYPDELEPVSPGILDLPTSKYFEITPNRAGYLYSRSEWDNEEAAFFAFVTRDEDANHQHYDMNSFLFSAFGEEYATHTNIYPYKDSLHGVDFEHNLVIVDGGGMPLKDNLNSAGDDNSMNGYMTGLGTGHFGDYVRGDAALSYKDRSLPESKPAIRADRYGAFIKQGPNPYIIMVDDIQKSLDGNHEYDWLWYSKALELSGGKGSLDDPLIVSGENGNCAIGFIMPEQLTPEFKVVKRIGSRHQTELGLINVPQTGNRVNYFAIAAAWRNGEIQPVFESGSEITGNPEAKSLILKGNGFTDHIMWQPEKGKNNAEVELTSKDMMTDAFLTVVRVNDAGKVTGYMMGDGSQLRFKKKWLVRGDHTWTVSADRKKLMATGPRRARENLLPLHAKGLVWLPDQGTEVFVDNKKVVPKFRNKMAVIGDN